MTFQSAAADTYNNVPLIPGEGVRADNGVYAYMSNVDSTQIFYG